jgi:hypothetical protein
MKVRFSDLSRYVVVTCETKGSGRLNGKTLRNGAALEKDDSAHEEVGCTQWQRGKDRGRQHDRVIVVRMTA